MEPGSEISFKGNKFLSATLQNAASSGDHSLVKRMLESYGPQYRSQDICLANADGSVLRVLDMSLMHAASANHIECVRLLLQANADPKAGTPKRGSTALMMAAQYASSECVVLLLEGKADVSQQCRTVGDTALMAACSNLKEAATPENAWALLHYGSDPEASAHDGTTPLIYAAINGYCDCVDMLVDGFGASVNAVDGNERNALHHAVGHMTEVLSNGEPGSERDEKVSDYVGVIHVLIENGATREPDRFGLVPDPVAMAIIDNGTAERFSEFDCLTAFLKGLIPGAESMASLLLSEWQFAHDSERPEGMRTLAPGDSIELQEIGTRWNRTLNR